MGYAVAAGVPREGVGVVGVLGGMRQQDQLTTVEGVESLQPCLHLVLLGDLLLQVAIEIVDRLRDHPELVNEEVGGVALIGLGLQKGTFVLSPGLADEPRDRQVLGKPVVVLAHRPEEEDAGSTAVAVFEGVVICEPEVQQDRPDHRVHELLALVRFVCEAAEHLHPLRQFLGGRGPVDRVLPIVPVEDRHPLLIRPLQPAGRIRILQRSLGDDPVQFQHRLRGQVSAEVVPNELKRPVVVGDHPLTVVFGAAAAPQHLLRNETRGRRTLELAGADRLLHQRVD